MTPPSATYNGSRPEPLDLLLSVVAFMPSISAARF
jgi:hypothetical protein